jgi:hypothetical protein
MDANYLKETVGPIVAEALTDLILHGRATTHPQLSSNPQTNPLTTSQDPVSYVARYLLNHSQQQDLKKKEEAESAQLKSLVNRLRTLESQKWAEQQQLQELEAKKAEALAAGDGVVQEEPKTVTEELNQQQEQPPAESNASEAAPSAEAPPPPPADDQQQEQQDQVEAPANAESAGPSSDEQQPSVSDEPPAAEP